MTISMKKRMFQLLVGSVFAIGAVTAAFSVAVSVKQQAEDASPEGQRASESLALDAKIAALQLEEQQRTSLEARKVEYEHLVIDKAYRDAGFADNQNKVN